MKNKGRRGNLKDNSIDKENIRSAVGFFYLTPILLNYLIGWYFKDQIRVKGAILTGFALYCVASMLMLVVLFGIYSAFYALYEINEKRIRQTTIFKKFICSPFFVLWVVTLVYQNFILGVYYTFAINILLYILLFYFQHEFIKKMKNSSN